MKSALIYACIYLYMVGRVGRICTLAVKVCAGEADAPVQVMLQCSDDTAPSCRSAITRSEIVPQYSHAASTVVPQYNDTDITPA